MMNLTILSLNPLDYEKVQKAFQNLSFDHSEMLVFSTGLGLMFAIFNIMRASKPMLEKGVDASLFFSLFKEYAHIIALILFMPIAIESLEYIFSEISTAYKEGFGNAPKDSIDSIAGSQVKEATSTTMRIVKSLVSTESSIGIALDGLITLSIKPFFELINNWSYGLALVYRFIYLGALKMVSGVALACYIYEPTRAFFYTWVKNLFICYLLVPGFLFVAVFVDAIREEYMNTESHQLGILIICIMAKLAGFGQIQKTLQNSF